MRFGDHRALYHVPIVIIPTLVKILFSEISDFFPENPLQEFEFFADIWHKIQYSMAIWVNKINLLMNKSIFSRYFWQQTPSNIVLQACQITK